MKRNFLLTLALFLSFVLANAQTPLTTATDFNVTDTDGNSYNLFSVLNSGKYVCLDFFFTTCGPCQATSPYYKETFTNFGCNSQDIFFISIDQGDTDAEVEQFETTYLGGNAGYPVISGSQGGGNAVCNTYGPAGYPTYILIAPNKQIIENDMWPISNAASFSTYFNSHSLNSKACTATGISKQTWTPEKISVYPNPAVNSLTIETSNNDKLNRIKVFDMLGNVLVNESLDKEKKHELDLGTLEKGVYFAEITTENNTAIRKFNKQ
jgi:thiol-disulfide isomerase/thioredoxin